MTCSLLSNELVIHIPPACPRKPILIDKKKTCFVIKVMPEKNDIMLKAVVEMRSINTDENISACEWSTVYTGNASAVIQVNRHMSPDTSYAIRCKYFNPEVSNPNPIYSPCSDELLVPNTICNENEFPPISEAVVCSQGEKCCLVTGDLILFVEEYIVNEYGEVIVDIRGHVLDNSLNDMKSSTMTTYFLVKRKLLSRILWNVKM